MSRSYGALHVVVCTLCGQHGGAIWDENPSGCGVVLAFHKDSPFCGYLLP